MPYTTKSPEIKSKIAVCLYLYHIDLWPEFKQLLLPLKNHIKLYIGLCRDNPILLDFDQFDYQLSFHDNYGADVAPFLFQLSTITEKYFVKLHSKKSFWGYKFHINWRQFILNDLIGSYKIFISNIKQLSLKSKYGILCNKQLLMSNREVTNSKHIQHLCDILKIDYNIVKDSKFVAGNMFIAKTDLFKKVFTPDKINIINKLLMKEKGKINDGLSGTYSHGMERLFGYIVSLYNYKFCYPKHQIIKILNEKAPNKKYFKLIKMYNNYCYLNEDPNVYGYYYTQNNNIYIFWHHQDKTIKQKYKKINNSTIIKFE